MPPTNSAEDEDTSSPQTPFSRQTSRVRDFFSVPAPVKTLFNSVPILTYPPNDLPQRALKPTRVPILYVFSTKEDAAAGRPSFNPSCLKWQVGRDETATKGGIWLIAIGIFEYSRNQSPSSFIEQSCLSIRLSAISPPCQRFVERFTGEL